jgi:CysZ protein
MMDNTPLHGLNFVLLGLRLITRPGLRRFVIIPLLINTLLFGSVIVLGGGYFGEVLERLLPDWLDWLYWLLVPIFGLALLIVTFYTFTIVANILSAPFNSILAEKVEQHLLGNDLQRPGQSDQRGIAREALVAIGSELRKLRYFLLRAVPLLLLFLIPGINLAAPFLWAGFSAWFLSLEYGDFPLGNRGLSFPEQRVLQGKRRWQAMGFGTGVLVMTMVPVLNFLSLPVGVAGATGMWVRATRQTDSGAARVS